MLKLTSIATKMATKAIKNAKVKKLKVKVKRLPNLVFRGLKLSQGNKKLQGNDEINFLVWNILAIITCTYSTENCRKFCYANKIERVYKNTKARNKSNTELSKEENFVVNMIAGIEKMLLLPKNINRVTYFRIHESGDFYNLEYLTKWIMISNHFKGDSRIVFQAYTKSIPIIAEYLELTNSSVESINIHFTSSIWNDTDISNIELTKKLGLQTSEAFTKIELSDQVANENYFECECIDCGKCGECYKNKSKRIAVKIH
jgi:hypothetical protein